MSYDAEAVAMGIEHVTRPSPDDGHLDVTLDALTTADNLGEDLLPVGDESFKDILPTAVIVSYLITFVVGVVGNGMVIFIIGYYSQIRASSVYNYYIWNLSFADLFYTFTSPFYCYATYTKDWQFGELICKVAQVFKETNRFASVFTLVALSVDRYLASFYNCSRWRTTRVGVLVCCGIWLMCGLISIPAWMYSTAAVINSTGGHECRLDWPAETRRQLIPFWMYFKLTFGLIIPFIAISLSYILLARNLHLIFRNSSARPSGQPQPNRRITRTIFVVVLVFLLCQTPDYVVGMISLKVFEGYMHDGHMPSAQQTKAFVIFNTVAQILVFISSCCNPVIYGLLNENYRKLYGSVICGHCRQPIDGARCTTTSSIRSRRSQRSDSIHQQAALRGFHVTLCNRFKLGFKCACCAGESRNRKGSQASAFSQRRYKMSVMSMSLDAITGFRTQTTDHLDIDEKELEVQELTDRPNETNANAKVNDT